MPSRVHSWSVSSCVFTSTRLCTWIRSIGFARSLRIECSISSMPRSRPEVQTFVAMNSFDRRPSLSTTSPMTSSARPYIGDESITQPPRATNSLSSSSSGRRSAGEFPTSKVCHVPSPMTGSASSVDEIARLIIAPGRAAKTACRETGRECCRGWRGWPAPLSIRQRITRQGSVQTRALLDEPRLALPNSVWP